MLSLWQWVAFLISFHSLKFVENFASPLLGPADFNYKTMEICNGVDQQGGLHVTITPRKFNRTLYVYDLVLQSSYDLGDHLTVEFKGSLRKEGGFKQGSFNYKGPLCETFYTLVGNIMDDFLKAIGVEECPVPAGIYSVNSFILNNEKFNVPQLYGDYQTIVNIRENKELKNCFVSYYEFIPKES